MNYENRPLVEITAVRYGVQSEDLRPIRITEPTVIPGGNGLGYTVDLSAFGIAALVHIRIDDMPGRT